MPKNLDRLRILGVPLLGPFAGKVVLLSTIDGNLTIVGSGRCLHMHAQAPWVAEIPCDRRIYAWSRRFGPVLVKCPARKGKHPSLKALREHLGSGFLPVQQGILVAASECLVADLRERMCGLLRSEIAGEPVIDWVICSRRGTRVLIAFIHRARSASAVG